MQFVIPEGAQVHITIGASPPMLALPSPAALPTAATGSRYRVLKSLLALCLVAGAFQAGRYLPGHQAIASVVNAVAQASPQSAGAASPAIPQAQPPSPAGGIPADFSEQLARQPQIVPPPGQASQPSGAPAPTNPFGLQG